MLPIEPFYEELLRCCLQAAGLKVDEVMQDVTYIDSTAILNFLHSNYDQTICKVGDVLTLLGDKDKGLFAISDKLDDKEKGLLAIYNKLDDKEKGLLAIFDKLSATCQLVENRETSFEDLLLKQNMCETKLGDIDTSLALAISKISDNGDELVRLHMSISQIIPVVNSLSTMLTNLTSTIDKITSQLGDVKTTVESSATTLTAVSKDISGLTSSVDEIAKLITHINAQLTTLKTALDAYKEQIDLTFRNEVTRIYSLYSEQIVGWNQKIEQNILKWVDKSEQAESLRLSLVQVLDQLNARVSDLRSSLTILGDINVSASKYATWVASAAAMSQLLGELTAAVGHMRDNITCLLEIHKDLVKSSETSNLIGACNAAANIARAGGVVADSVTNASRLKQEEDKKW